MDTLFSSQHTHCTAIYGDTRTTKEFRSCAKSLTSIMSPGLNCGSCIHMTLLSPQILPMMGFSLVLKHILIYNIFNMSYRKSLCKNEARKTRQSCTYVYHCKYNCKKCPRKKWSEDILAGLVYQFKSQQDPSKRLHCCSIVI